MAIDRSLYTRAITVKITQQQFDELINEVERQKLHRADLLREWIINGTKKLKVVNR